MTREETLADVLPWLLLFVEDAADRHVDLDEAVKTLEDAAAAFSELGADDRTWLAGRFAAVAAKERDPRHRERLERLPEQLGLVDDE